MDKAKRLQELVVAMLEGRTQTELGEMLGVSQSAIGKIVSGRNRPGVQISDGLERLGLPRSYIFSQKPATDWERYVGMDERTEAPVATRLSKPSSTRVTTSPSSKPVTFVAYFSAAWSWRTWIEFSRRRSRQSGKRRSVSLVTRRPRAGIRA